MYLCVIFSSNMYKTILLVFLINKIHLLNGRPEPYTYYHRNYTSQTSHHTSTGPEGNRTYEPVEHRHTYHRVPNVEKDEPSHLSGTHARTKRNVTGRNCVYGVCEYAVDYPEDLIQSLLNKTKEVESFFNIIPPIIGTRFDETSENLCDTTVNITYPQVAQNVDSKNRIIANDEKYRQGLIMETCRQSSCKFSDLWPLGYKSVCEQKFRKHKLLALDDEMKNTMVDTFSIPSCCVCMSVKG